MTRYHVPPATAEGNGYTIVENAALDTRNTFRVAARAKMLIDVRRKEALAELFGFAALKRGDVLVLGEGSNVVLSRDVGGVVLSLATRGFASKPVRTGTTSCTSRSRAASPAWKTSRRFRARSVRRRCRTSARTAS